MTTTRYEVAKVLDAALSGTIDTAAALDAILSIPREDVFVLCVKHESNGIETTVWSNKEAANAAGIDAEQDDEVLWADVEQAPVRDVFPVA